MPGGIVMGSLVFRSVGKVFPDGTRAVSDFTLDVADGEFVVLVGPSGCGKTTALRMVAGLEEISEGEIQIGARVVNDLEPQERDIAMVFQNYALYPQMSVRDNMSFGLKVRSLPKAEIEPRVEEIARVLGLVDLLERKPRNLSGGQRQRVAMGRAIVRRPSVFLMDEPLSNLDARLRVQMRAEIARIQRELGATTVYVTHDQVEAMTMGDRVAVLRDGRVLQTDEPQALFDRPVNLFVATFIGSPAMNLMQARLDRSDDGYSVSLGQQRLLIPAFVAAEHADLPLYEGKPIGVGIRPDYVENAAAAPASSDAGELRGKVILTEALGSELLIHLEVAVSPVVTQDVLDVAADPSVADELRLKQAEGRTVVVARSATGSRPQLGEEIVMSVRTDKLHFFDLDSGDAIYGGSSGQGRPSKSPPMGRQIDT
jgi:multiple sugar transport system ATP-binding protein